MTAAHWLVRDACLACGRRADVLVRGGRIAAVGPGLSADAPMVEAGGRLLCAGLVDTHVHLDKSCILDRCPGHEGTLAEAVALTAAAKRHFTADDVYARGRRTLERAIGWGTTRMRTHVELDPGIGLRGLEAVEQLRRDYAWAIDLQICVFPQEGLTNSPATAALLAEGLRRGATAIGAAPYTDPDPADQVDQVFALAREHGVDIDMHLDLLDSTDGMQLDHVCRRTAEFGWGGRVTVGHVTALAWLDRARLAQAAARLADAGVAVTVLPATDLFLMGRHADGTVPRGVAPAGRLAEAGVTCSVATNNVLNPFTPYGDANLLRMANLQANIGHAALPAAMEAHLAMVTTAAARLMRCPDYGIEAGNPADLVLLDAPGPAAAVAELAQPLWAMKAGRFTLTRPRPVLHTPAGDRAPAA